MIKVNSKKFFRKVEEMKKINSEEPVIEITSIDYGEIENLRLFLESKTMVKWNWDYNYGTQMTGYLNGFPFATFQNPLGVGGVLVSKNKIAMYSKDHIDMDEYNHYDEYNYKDNCVEWITKKTNNEKEYGISSVELLGKVKTISHYYVEATKSTFNYADQLEINKHNMLARDVLKELNSLNLAARMSNDVEKDWCFNSYNVHIYNSLNDDANNVSCNADCYANYSSQKHYLEGGLPYNIHFTLKDNQETEEISKYFILLKDGRYVDTDLYFEKGLEGSIVTLDEIKQMLKENKLSLDISEKLKEFVINDGIPSLDVKAVLSEDSGRKLS